MNNKDTTATRLTGRTKFLVDFGPLAVFFVAYFFGAKLTKFVGSMQGASWCLKEGAEMYLSVAAFMPAFAVAFAYSVWKEKRIAPMLMVSGIMIGVLGTLTLVLQNKTFFYMKPSIIYVLFGGVLLFGLSSGRNFLKTMFDDALQLPDDAWRKLTKHYALFFIALAVANEIAWRWLTRDCGISLGDEASSVNWLLRDCAAPAGEKCSGEAAWVNLKIFGFTAANIVFVASQMPLLMKHMPDDSGASNGSDDETGSSA